MKNTIFLKLILGSLPRIVYFSIFYLGKTCFLTTWEGKESIFYVGKKSCLWNLFYVWKFRIFRPMSDQGGLQLLSVLNPSFGGRGEAYDAREANRNEEKTKLVVKTIRLDAVEKIDEIAVGWSFLFLFFEILKQITHFFNTKNLRKLKLTRKWRSLIFETLEQGTINFIWKAENLSLFGDLITSYYWRRLKGDKLKRNKIYMRN